MIQSCRSCQTAFEIEDDDLAFYEKASPIFAGKKELIPPPTLCPPCRNKRRMAWRNERSLYNGTCEVCKRDRITMFRPGTRVHQVCPDCYYTDKWDPATHGREYDLSSTFAENFARLLADVPLMTLWQTGVNVNCDYMNMAGSGSKNCYLIFNSGNGDEDCYYARGMIRSKNCMDILIAADDEWCYENVNCSGCYRLFHGQNCTQCTDSAFLFNCVGCKNCIGCVNLRHQEYMIFNRKCTKEEYGAFMAKMGSNAFATAAKQRFSQIVRESIHRENNNVNAEGCSGDYVLSSQNCLDCFEVHGSQDCKWMSCTKHSKDSQDCFGFGYNSELLYENVAVGESTRTAFSFTCDTVSDSLYCVFCKNSPDCFGCIGLIRKQYCVFNKQYSKEEYEALVPRIIETMRKSREWGEYFPADLSPFGYNETVGMEYDPMTKGEALSRGFNWTDYVAPPPKVEKVVSASRLPDDIKDIPDEILHWAVECEVTGKPFKVIKPELKFLRENNLPFPRRHPDTRHFDRVALRNPRKLFDRSCAKCAKAMKTSYAPERPERVYCEECYRREVY